MRYQYIFYVWLLAASAFTSMSLGIYALVERRNAKGAASFILSMIVVTTWSSANALEMASVDLSTKLFWANVQYFAYCYSPVTLLALCMEFTGNDRWIRNRKVLWLAVLPTIIILLVWTNNFHGLVRYGIHMDYSGEFPVISKKYGPAFFIHATYSQSLNILAGILLIKAVFYKNTVYRKQALSLFIGLSLIVIPNIMYITGLSPIKRFDITPLFFAPAGLITAVGIFRFKLFDVIPVAWATVIRTMDAGVMVLDLQDRVLDVNPAFERIVGYSASAASTRPVKQVCADIPELATACLNRQMTHTEFSVNMNGLTRIYEALLSPLADKRKNPIGRLAVIYEITKKKQEQQEYLRQQWKQAVATERERNALDLHDNLGQELGFISMQAQGIRQELKNAGIELVVPQLDRLIGIAQAANNELREYIRNARNEKAVEENFVTALKHCISGLEEQTGARARLDIPSGFPWEEFAPDVRIHILNIVKESLNNVRKHAEAANVTVSFSLVRDQLCLAVEDDGKGFDVTRLKNKKNDGFGLNIMQERASKIGGQIDIESTPGRGSRVSLRLPFQGGKKECS